MRDSNAASGAHTKGLRKVCCEDLCSHREPGPLRSRRRSALQNFSQFHNQEELLSLAAHGQGNSLAGMILEFHKELLAVCDPLVVDRHDDIIRIQWWSRHSCRTSRAHALDKNASLAR